MEFTARTVTHPNPKVSKADAEAQLRSHPEFKPGTIIVAMGQKGGQWVASLHEPKLAGDPPPFAEPSDSAPTDEAKPPSDEDPLDEALKDEESKDESSDEPKEDESKSEKVELSEINDLVHQIADAVGVHPDASKDEPSDPASGPHPAGPDLPPGPAGPPPSDPSTKSIIHRKNPPGAVPIGSPAFASTQPKVASFELSEEVPEDFTIAAAKQEIEGLYGQYGYKVKRIAADQTPDGKRVIRAKVSVR